MTGHKLIANAMEGSYRIFAGRFILIRDWQRLQNPDPDHALWCTLQSINRLAEGCIGKQSLVYGDQPIAWNQSSINLGHTSWNQAANYDQRDVWIELVLLNDL